MLGAVNKGFATLDHDYEAQKDDNWRKEDSYQRKRNIVFFILIHSISTLFFLMAFFLNNDFINKMNLNVSLNVDTTTLIWLGFPILFFSGFWIVCRDERLQFTIAKNALLIVIGAAVTGGLLFFCIGLKLCCGKFFYAGMYLIFNMLCIFTGLIYYYNPDLDICLYIAIASLIFGYISGYLSLHGSEGHCCVSKKITFAKKYSSKF